MVSIDISALKAGPPYGKLQTLSGKLLSRQDLYDIFCRPYFRVYRKSKKYILWSKSLIVLSYLWLIKQLKLLWRRLTRLYNASEHDALRWDNLLLQNGVYSDCPR
jgi:hypothetical protein